MRLRCLSTTKKCPDKNQGLFTKSCQPIVLFSETAKIPKQLTFRLKPLRAPPDRAYLALRRELGLHNSQKGCKPHGLALVWYRLFTRFIIIILKMCIFHILGSCATAVLRFAQVNHAGNRFGLCAGTKKKRITFHQAAHQNGLLQYRLPYRGW